MVTELGYITRPAGEGLVLRELVADLEGRKTVIERAEQLARHTGKPIMVYRIAIDGDRTDKAIVVRIDSIERLTMTPNVEPVEADAA